MKLSFFGIKASTLCVGGSLLMLGGFMSVGLAGCGGGGGGGGVASNRVSANVQLILQSGEPAALATLNLLKGNRVAQSLQADENGLVTIPRIAPGTYTYQFTLEGDDTPSTGTVTINAVSGQTYTLFEGEGNQFRFRISGTVFLNPSGDADPDLDQNTSNCTANSDPVTAPLRIQVRDLETVTQPIIAQAIRPLSDTGQYTITIPRRVLSFRVEVSEATDEGEVYRGIGGITSFPNTVDTVTDVNICANDTNTAPVAAAPGATTAPTTAPTTEPTVEPTVTTAPTSAPTSAKVKAKAKKSR